MHIAHVPSPISILAFGIVITAVCKWVGTQKKNKRKTKISKL
jgi:hypothetical protein